MSPVYIGDTHQNRQKAQARLHEYRRTIDRIDVYLMQHFDNSNAQDYLNFRYWLAELVVNLSEGKIVPINPNLQRVL